MARIIVTGYMLRHPVAGNLLAYFQYVLGFHRLGHEVMYLEESGWSYSCYDPEKREWQDHPETGLRIVSELMAEHGLDIPLCYVNRETGTVIGAEWNEIKRMIGAADLLINVGGVCWLPEFLLCRRRLLIDLDPLFTQVEMFGAKSIDDYQYHFSYGSNIGKPFCTIPTDGVDWLPTVPPVVSGLWNDAAAPSKDAPFTTIANWSAYGGITYEGEFYGQKDEEFLRLINLPQHTLQKLELAISGAEPQVRERLKKVGWSVRDAGEEVSTDIDTYRKYIFNSRGELSAAKNAYVKTNSGWFSDRSVCYLAAGLPVILQNTGFTDWLSADGGVQAFSTLDEAVGCIEKVNADYLNHRRAARKIAEEVFSYKVVLPRLIDIAVGAQRSNSKLI
ncbi:MAG TPA: hypothetical protein VF599_24275 [Pyrinomonadaceae bacterium]